MNEYSIPKPIYPILLKLLAGLVAVGLFGLGIVSFHTFSAVHGPIVAAIYSALIEVGAAVDMIGLAGGITKRTWWIVPAVLITIIGSGWYNYAAVAASEATWGITDAAQLDLVRHAIAWLPLASLSFMALGLGFKIADHESSIKQWEIGRQAWRDAQALQAEQARKDAQDQERQARLEEKRIEGESLERIRLAEIKAQERQEQRAASLERSRIKQEQARNIPENSTGTGANVPPAVPPTKGTYQDYLQFMASNGANHTRAELAGRFNVTERCITKWAARYREEHPTPAMELN